MKWYFVILIVVMISVNLFSACEMEPIDFVKKDVEQTNLPHLSFQSSSQKNYIFKSTSQVDEYINEIKDKFFEDHSNSLEAQEQAQKEWEEKILPAYNAAFSKYNDVFFTKSNLVMILLYTGINTIKLSVKNLYVKNNELHVKINRFFIPGPTPGIVVSVCFFIQLLKESFNGDKVYVDQ